MVKGLDIIKVQGALPSNGQISDVKSLINYSYDELGYFLLECRLTEKEKKELEETLARNKNVVIINRYNKK